jgi:tight adherence protein B
MEAIAIFFLAAAAVGGVVWVFVYPILSGNRRAEKRIGNLAKPEPVARVAAGAQKSRREVLESALKEVEGRHKKSRKKPLSVRLTQAGLSLSYRQFLFVSIGIGGFFFAITTLFGQHLIIGAAAGFAGALGLPNWTLAYLKKRREARFLEVFPDAVDVIVRGVKTGLPLLDCIKINATEAPEPVKSEFRAIIESQAFGTPLGDACAKLYERIPIPEANFFGIVIAIQQRAGGNLSEALANLSRVLRDRKKMKGKIQAMSQEAKASASIIGALPIAVMTLIYFLSPNYITVLFTNSLGHLMLAGSAAWMLIGILVMKKMINFDF